MLYGENGKINKIFYDDGTPYGMQKTKNITYPGRAGVGGSNDEGIGSSGKVLETGDVATKWAYDSPVHNTEIHARYYYEYN